MSGSDKSLTPKVGSTPPLVDHQESLQTTGTSDTKHFGMFNQPYTGMIASETYAGPVVLGSKFQGKESSFHPSVPISSPQSSKVFHSEKKLGAEPIYSRWNAPGASTPVHASMMPEAWAMPDNVPVGDHTQRFDSFHSTKPQHMISRPKSFMGVGGYNETEVPSNFVNDLDPNYRYFYKYYPVLVAVPREEDIDRFYQHRAPAPAPPIVPLNMPMKKFPCGPRAYQRQLQYAPLPRVVRVPDYYNAYEPLPASPRIRPTRKTDSSFIDCINNFLDSICLQPPPPVTYYVPPPVAPTQGTGLWCLDKANEILDDWTVEALPPPPPPPRQYYGPCDCGGSLFGDCLGTKHRPGYCPECDHLRCHRCGRLTTLHHPPKRGILC